MPSDISKNGNKQSQYVFKQKYLVDYHTRMHNCSFSQKNGMFYMHLLTDFDLRKSLCNSNIALLRTSEQAV